MHFPRTRTKRSEQMSPGTLPANNILNANTTNDESVSDERTVATPRHCFGTHQRATFLLR
jgi:hypothetical protein